jgi:hypothetical protein
MLQHKATVGTPTPKKDKRFISFELKNNGIECFSRDSSSLWLSSLTLSLSCASMRDAWNL